MGRSCCDQCLTTRNATPKRDGRHQMNKTPSARFAQQIAYLRLGALHRQQLGNPHSATAYTTLRHMISAFVRTIYRGSPAHEQLAIRAAFRQARADYETIEVPRG